MDMQRRSLVQRNRRCTLRQAALGFLTVLAMVASVRGALAATATDLLIRATVKSFVVGSPGRYAVVVSNAGRAATDAPISVIDTLPNGLTLAGWRGAGWACTAAGQAVTCTNSSPLSAGRSSLLALTVAVADAALPQVTNTLAVSYPADTNPSNDSVTRTTLVKARRRGTRSGTATPTTAGTVLPSNTPTAAGTSTPTATATITPTPVPAATDLLLVKTTSGAFTVGANGTYILTVSNVGANDTNATFTVTDPLPSTLQFVSATGAGWACAASGQTVTCDHATPLARGVASSISLTVHITAAVYPSVTNVATLTYPADANLGNNTGRRPTTIRQ